MFLTKGRATRAYLDIYRQINIYGALRLKILYFRPPKISRGGLYTNSVR